MQLVDCGWRHHNCIGILHMIPKYRKYHTQIQGFVTSKGNFLDRDEAKELAFNCGQIYKTIAKTLTSEDLW